MEIRMLKADQGDAIWLRFNDGLTYRNILVDSGPGSNRGNLKQIQEKLIEKGECFDLVVISHIDDDHVEGLGVLYSNGEMNLDIYREMWINQGNDYKVPTSKYSPNKGRNFIEELKGTSIRVINKVTAGYIRTFGNTVITVLSPDEKAYDKMVTSWEKVKSTATYGAYSDVRADIDAFRCSIPDKNDGSDQNQASIVLHIKYKDTTIILTGDTDKKTLIRSATEVLGENKVEVDILKLPHHGSRYNSSIELFDKFPTNSYIVSTDGSGSKPHKQTMAWMLDSADDKPLTVYCNYRWWLQGKFTKGDIEKYIKSKKLMFVCLDEQGTTLDCGVTLYNE